MSQYVAPAANLSDRDALLLIDQKLWTLIDRLYPQREGRRNRGNPWVCVTSQRPCLTFGRSGAWNVRLGPVPSRRS
jgi:hypothetical protein